MKILEKEIIDNIEYQIFTQNINNILVMISHTKDQFIKGLNKKENFIIFKRFSISQIDPTQFFIEYTKNKKYGFIFESVEKEVIRGRYTICGHSPQIIIKDKDKVLNIRSYKINKKINNKNPLTGINELIKALNLIIQINYPQCAQLSMGILAMKLFTM